MAIKFRCSECGHGIKVPDKAAGKGIKCPQCGAKVRVPSGTPRKRAPKKKQSSDSDSSEFLANLDIDRIAEADVQLCQKCAAEIPEGETACPECGFDPADLTAAGRRRKKMAAKGIDPASYYEKLWKEPFSFALSHIGLIFKTGFILTFFFLMAAMCGYFLIWVATGPPFSFWVLVTTVSVMIPFGWLLTVHREVIQATLDRKERIKKINFDFALCGMNGIKFFAWLVVFGLPFWILFGGLGVLLDYLGISAGFPIGAGLALLSILVLAPQAMSHLAMPVEQPGWFVHKIFPSLRISFLPGVMWAILFVIVNLPLFGAIATVYFVGGQKIENFVAVRKEEGKIHTAKVMLDKAEGASSEERKNELIEKYSDDATLEAPEKDWNALTLPLSLGVISCFYLGFTSLVVGRANGLFTFHLKKALNLIASVKEKKYVRQEKEEKIRTRRTTLPATSYKRVIAIITDGVILNFIVTPIIAIALYVMSSLDVDFESPTVMMSIQIGSSILELIVAGIYFATGEAGVDQATFGKKTMGLYVCDDEYRPISTLQGWGRYLGYTFLTPLTLFISVLMALFREDGKTLHDLITGTQVRMDKVKKKKKSEEDQE